MLRTNTIKVAVKRGTIFSILVIAITMAYIMLAFIISWAIFGGTYTLKSQIITGLIVAISISAGFIPFYEWLRESTDKFLFKGTYNPQELLANISDTLSRTLNLDKIEKNLKKKIVKSMRVSKMAIMILPNKNLIFKEDQKNKKEEIISSFQKIIDYFKKNKSVLVLEELNNPILIKDLEKIKTDLIVPLYIKKKLIGLFLLGNKKSGDIFSVGDIRTLETIASQSAIAIENALLYEEMKNFSIKLQNEVDCQTKDLRKANEKLKQLDKAKSLFISLASHQLRTPLTAIKGYVSMLLERTWGELNKKQESKLKNVFISNERLINLVEELLNISRIESGRLEFNYKKISLEEITKEIVQDFIDIAKDKNLYLKFEKSNNELPLVKADPLKIRQVIQNLIDNALYYTEKGGITVGVAKSGEKITISVKDTGIGIAKEEENILFEKFSRGINATKMFTEGTGLGLYFCKKLIRAHKGDIWAESEGKNKGSAFFVSLPVGE
ncbi:ATP-binding protein [Patescibacteria group bacterium]